MIYDPHLFYFIQNLWISPWSIRLSESGWGRGRRLRGSALAGAAFDEGWACWLSGEIQLDERLQTEGDRRETAGNGGRRRETAGEGGASGWRGCDARARCQAPAGSDSVLRDGVAHGGELTP